MTHATDNDNISPENAEPPNKKASKSGSRENTAYLKTVHHWKKDLTIDLGYKLSKLEHWYTGKRYHGHADEGKN